MGMWWAQNKMSMRLSWYRIKLVWDGEGTGLNYYGMEWVQDEVSMGWSWYKMK